MRITSLILSLAALSVLCACSTQQIVTSTITNSIVVTPSGCSSDKSILKTAPGVSLLTQAGQTLGTQFPRPLSLPDGYEVKLITFGGSNTQVVFEISKADNTLTLRITGGDNIIPLKLIGYQVVAINNDIGYLSGGEVSTQLWWDMTPPVQPANPVAFEITIIASTNTPDADMLAIARGVGWDD